MRQQLKIKKRDAPQRLRAGTRRVVGRRGAKPSQAMASLGAAAFGTPAPTLVMYEPEGMRSTLVTGSITALIHLTGVLALILMAMLAPTELIQEIIPVEIMRDGAPIELLETMRDSTAVELLAPDLEPAPAPVPAPAGPKSVGPLRPSAAVMAASQMLSPAQAEALRQAALEAGQRVVQQEMQLEAQQEIALPTQIDRREVSADGLATFAAAAQSPTAPVDVSAIEAIEVEPRDRSAPIVHTSGPREIDTAHLGDLSAPEAFASLSALGTREYTGAVSASDFDAARATGSAFGVARCMQSESVARYIERVEERTIQRWIVPEGFPSDMQVGLRFKLGVAGTISDIEVIDVEDEALASSARQALRSAAPFPPMNDNVRCMADKSLRATFDVPNP